MTNEEAEKILFYHRSTGNLSPMLNEALDLAISALSKQCASTEQADKKLFGHGYWLMPGEVFISHNVLNEVLDTIIKSMNTEQRKIDSILAKTAENDEAPPDSDQIADGSKMVDQFREDTKKTDSERVSLSEQEKSNSFSKEPSESSDSEMNCSDVPDFHAGKTNFQPGDKFILELGQERRMFGEFEIAGTDLYVKTDLLEKLTRYEPGENPGNLGENPGIIRCNACKYWIQTVGRMQGYGLGKCDFHDANLVNCNGFCYWAERRNDGGFNQQTDGN